MVKAKKISAHSSRLPEIVLHQLSSWTRWMTYAKLEAEKENRIKNELFSAIDGVDSGSSQVVVIGATNHPENMIPAMQRRFTKRIHIDQPNKKARAGMLRLMVGKHSALSDSELGRFADHSEGFSAADVNGVAKDAFAQANRDLFAATVCRSAGGVADS
ncbi:hypothetical protein WJX82_007283 [Trebouxia sp. C0006]